MEYSDFIKAVQELGFMPDSAQADAAVKAVLGIFASRVPPAQAHHFTERLPAPLSFEKLRSHQARVALMLTTDDYTKEIAQQFKLELPQAAQLIDTVMRVTKQALGSEVVSELKDVLPPEWDLLFESV